jgi:hypothetical protein
LGWGHSVSSQSRISLSYSINMTLLPNVTYLQMNLLLPSNPN